MTILRSGSATDVGRIRQINQDVVLESPTLFAVADGMGGHAAGDVAARVAVETLHSAFDREPTVEGLSRAVTEANEAVWREGHGRDELRGMGTTITAAALVAGPDGRDVVALVNVGDSRAYLFSGDSITQITLDHSLAEERVRLGQLTEAQAAVDPRRHILTRALGVAEGVAVDQWELHLRAGDRLLLCSDGLSNEVAPEHLARILSTEHDPEQAARQLVAAANEHGGNDNISALVIDVLVGDEAAEGPSAAGVVAAGAAATVAIPEVPDTPATTGAPDGGAGPAGAADAAGGWPESDPGGRPSDMTMATAAVAAGGTATTRRLTRATTAGDTVDDAAWPDTPPPMPVVAPKAPATESRRERRRRLGVPRRITVRVVLFFLLLAGIFVAAYYGLRYYANDNWFVTVKGDQLVIYRGQPGGLLWFNPSIVDRTGYTTSQIDSYHVSDLRGDVDQSSLADARAYVHSLVQQHQSEVQAEEHPSGTTTTEIGPTGGISTVPPTRPFVPTSRPLSVTSTTVAPTTTTTVPTVATTTPETTGAT